MNYTIRLKHGQAFMAGVFDSAGNSFAIGPLHSGDGKDLRCLAAATGQTENSFSGIGKGALLGGVIAAFLVGALGALMVAWGFDRRKRGGRPKSVSSAYLYSRIPLADEMTEGIRSSSA